MNQRDLYAQLALSYVPHLTQLCDKNPYSPTYGCFDREYWHYRTLDFPCGMSQEMVLPFAQLFAMDLPGNIYYQWERMRELAIAGTRYAIRGSHADGSCDDYFPYEQALGALAFSTYAITEAYQILGLDDAELVAFFRKRGDLFIRYQETGQLSNHQAFVALAAYNIFLITGDDRHRQHAEDRMALALSWQNADEGWFQEYEGADPGYHTCTIAFLSKLLKKSEARGKPYSDLVAPLVKAVDFAWWFMHPDGSYGGEYGSRNTYHFYPHGFEYMSRHTPKAGQIADGFLRSIARDRRYHNDDDRMCAHNVYDWLHAWEDYREPRDWEPIETRENFDVWMPGCGTVARQTDAYHAVANLNKGGAIKVFSRGDDARCVASDTGLIGELDDGRVVVSHLMDAEHQVAADPAAGEYRCAGVLSKRPSKLSSPLKLIIFRALNITIGRFFPNLLRSLIQKMLITGKNRTPHKFERAIHLGETSVAITDRFPDPVPLRRLSAGSDATSIYVANSNVYQESVLRAPWTHADEGTVQKARNGGMEWERNIEVQID